MRIDDATLKDWLGTIAKRATVTGFTVLEGGMSGQDGIVKNFPAIPVDKIQDTDPSSPTFGHFYWMLGVDPLP